MRKPPDLLNVRAENRKQVMSCSNFHNMASVHKIDYLGKLQSELGAFIFSWHPWCWNSKFRILKGRAVLVPRVVSDQ